MLRSHWKTRLKKYIRPLFALVGIGAVVLLIHEAGARELWDAFTRMIGWFPLILGLELIRVGCDAECTYQALGECKSRIPRLQMFRAELISTSLGSIVPAGRSTQEASKAALLSPWIGGPQASVAAVVSQVATFFSGAIITIPSAWAAWKMTGSTSFLTLAMMVHTVALFFLGALLDLGMGSERIVGWIENHLSRFKNTLERFHRASESRRGFPSRPVLVLVTSRLVQTLQVGILLLAVGASISISAAFLGEGLLMLSLVAGAFIPGELGVSEGAFVYFAASLNIKQAQALSIALLLHAVKLTFILVGAFIPLLWKAKTTEDTQTSVDCR